MTPVVLIARHVFRDGARDRVLLALSVCAVILLLSGVAVAGTSAGQTTRVLRDIGLATIELTGVLLVVGLGAVQVTHERQRRTVYALLARPLARWHIIVGTYCGIAATVVVHVTLLGGALAAVDAWAGGALPRTGLVQALVLMAGALLVLLAVALLLSTVSSRPLLAGAMALGVWVVGQLSADLQTFTAAGVVVVEVVVQALGHLVPQFAAFDLKAAAVHPDVAVSWGFVGITLAYAGVYVVAMVSAAVAVFSQQELP